MTLLLWAAIGAGMGAIIGSFLAVLILRLPEGRPVMGGRSMCDRCGRRLSPLELVPLFSALALRGRCRECGARIDPLHWRIELACAAIGGLALAVAPGISGVGWAVLGWMLLTLAVLDWRHFWLPDLLTLPLVFLGFTLALWTTDVTMPDRIIGASGGYLALLGVALGYRALRGREGLGLGDAKLLGALGAWFGWQALPFILLAASMTALLAVAIGMLAGRRVDARTRTALGSFLCLAAVPGWLLRCVLLP